MSFAPNIDLIISESSWLLCSVTCCRCLALTTRVPCILKGEILMCFFPSSSIKQIVRVSQSSRDVISSVYIFPRRRDESWISLRDTSVANGTSSRRSFGHCIHHHVPWAAFHLMQNQSMIERLGTSL